MLLPTWHGLCILQCIMVNAIWITSWYKCTADLAWLNIVIKRFLPITKVHRHWFPCPTLSNMQLSRFMRSEVILQLITLTNMTRYSEKLSETPSTAQLTRPRVNKENGQPTENAWWHDYLRINILNEYLTYNSFVFGTAINCINTSEILWRDVSEITERFV